LKNFQLYRTLQILNNGFNYTYAPLCMSFGSMSSCLCQIVFCVGAIKLYSNPHIPAFAYAMYPGVKIINFFMETSFTRIASKCHQINANIIDYWSHRYVRASNSSTIDKINRSFVRSCAPLAVHIGQIATVGRNAVFVTMDFTFQWTINVLLLWKCHVTYHSIFYIVIHFNRFPTKL